MEGNAIKNVIKSYYNCIICGKMKLEDVPKKYKKDVEMYIKEKEEKDG